MDRHVSRLHGHGRAPQDAPDELFPTMPEDLPFEEAIRFGKEIQESLPDWIVLVSALRDSDSSVTVVCSTEYDSPSIPH